MIATENRTTYVFDPAWSQELERLHGVEYLLDSASQRFLKELTIGNGWRCLEVGCGAGSMARWLAEQVGASGFVLATDRDVRFMRGVERANLQVRQHDLVHEDLDTATFDVAHARLVLEHIPERQQVLAKLVKAVRPGGWVLIEDIAMGPREVAAISDFVHPRASGSVLERVYAAVLAQYPHVGADAAYGAHLPGALREAGLQKVRGELFAPLLAGDTRLTWLTLTVQQLRQRLVTSGAVTDAEVDEALQCIVDPAASFPPPLMVAAWGQRP